MDVIDVRVEVINLGAVIKRRYFEPLTTYSLLVGEGK
jgi:hypothetical protein